MLVTQDTLEHSELINWTIFQELLLMDEDEEGFALVLVQTFVQQANDTFQQIHDLLVDTTAHNTDTLAKLSSLGHYLKGSAAALGLQKVQDECERMQNYGKREGQGPDGEPADQDRTIEQWFELCNEAYDAMKHYFNESKDLLAQYFETDL